MIRIAYKNIYRQYQINAGNTADTVGKLKELLDDAMNQVQSMHQVVNSQGVETKRLVMQLTHVSGVVERSLALNVELLRERGESEKSVETAILALKDRDVAGYQTYTHRFRMVL